MADHPAHRLGALAERFGLGLHGPADTLIEGVCTLAPGEPGRISFLASPKWLEALSSSRASAVIVSPRDAGALPGAGLIADNPQLAYARIAALFDGRRQPQPGLHPSAAIDPTAQLGTGVAVGAMAVIGAEVVIEDQVFVGPGVVIGDGAFIGAGTRIEARAVVGPDCRIGRGCQIEPGAVIGSRGFGNVPGPNGWEAIPQLGRVVIGDRVEVGANTTIDRGAIDDTLIEDNVRLDNLIQIAHNCVIGSGTAIAACTGIAGSTRIGRRCMIGGAVGIGGHLEIADEVVVLGRTMVTRSLLEKGVYGSGLPVDEAGEWRKTVARVRRLGRLEERVKVLERGFEKALGKRIERGIEGRAEEARPENNHDD